MKEYHPVVDAAHIPPVFECRPNQSSDQKNARYPWGDLLKHRAVVFICKDIPTAQAAVALYAVKHRLRLKTRRSREFIQGLDVTVMGTRRARAVAPDNETTLTGSLYTPIRAYLAGKTEITSAALLIDGLACPAFTRGDVRRVTSILRDLGWQRHKIPAGNVWRPAL